MKVLVTGGEGYIGALLVPHLIREGHEVATFDISNGGDVTDVLAFERACKGREAVIYLASISKNADCIANPKQEELVNRASFVANTVAARLCGVSRFIYASSVAAYGSSYMDATEDWPLEPTTPYGHGKASCERWLARLQPSDFPWTVTRSASVCGLSPNMRWDLTVNKMVHDAVRNGVIVVNGGFQKRCHIHILDICRAYSWLLGVPSSLISGQAFNFVAENASVLDTANLVAGETGAKIMIGPATDDRSYTVDGTKAREVLSFSPKCTVRDAVLEMMKA